MANPYKPYTSKSGGYQGFIKPARVKKANDRALETESSKFEKIMNFLGRFGAAERQAVINKTKGESVLSGLKEGITGRATPSGSDVITALRGSAPTTTTGKVAQAATGFLADVLNPFDPLTYLGAGVVRGGAKALQATGKLAPFAKGLIQGERAALGLSVPFTQKTIALTPKFLDKSAGQFLTGVGGAIKALPYADDVINALSKPFTKIATQVNRMKANTGEFAKTEAVRSRAGLLPALTKKAGKGIEAYLKKFNPGQLKQYKAMGIEPGEMVGREAVRWLERGLKSKQSGVVQFEKGTTKLKSEMNAFLKKAVPEDGLTSPTIKSIARIVAPSLERQGAIKQKLGIEGLLENYAPRVLSETTKKQMEKLGVQIERGDRTLKEITTAQAEALLANPKFSSHMAAEIIGSKTLEKEPGIASAFLDGFRQKNPKGAAFYEYDIAKSYGTALNRTARDVSITEAVDNLANNPSFARRTEKMWGDTKAVAVEIPSAYRGLLSKHKDFTGKGFKISNKGKVFVDPAVAPEFRRLMDVLTDSKRMNEFFAFQDTMGRTLTQLWKRWTLYAPPGSIPTISRNFMGNNFLSWFAGAWSPRGFADATTALNTVMKHADDPIMFNRVTNQMGDLGGHIRYMREANLFNESLSKEVLEGSKAWLPRTGNRAVDIVSAPIQSAGKLNETAENFSRIQHFMTRIRQGWTQEAAAADVRERLYDYVNGLPPLLQRFRNSPAGLPFVSWMYFNIPAMVEQSIKHPGKAMSLDRAKKNIESTIGVDSEGGKPDERALSEYIKGDAHIRLWMDEKTGKWTYLRLKGMVPVADLEDVLGLEKFASMMMASANPIIKTPIETYTNRSMFFKTAGGQPADIERYPGEMGEFLGMDMRKKNINILRQLRVLNEANRLLPSPSGAPRLQPQEHGLRMLGASMVPVDPNKDVQRAKMAFQQQKSALDRQKKYRSNNRKETSEIDKQLEALLGRSYVP